MLLDKQQKKIFQTIELDTEKTIRLMHIASRLDTAIRIPKNISLRFVCRDRKWRGVNYGLIAPSEINIDQLLPTEWLLTHTISDKYESDLTPEERIKWRKWITNPDKVGVLSFPLPEQVRSDLPHRNWHEELKNICNMRGGVFPNEFKLKSQYFRLNDWDWNKIFLVSLGGYR